MPEIKEQEWVSWSHFLGTMGNGASWSKKSKLHILNTLSDTDLLTMDPYELYIIIGQGNLPVVFKELMDSDANSEERIKTLREIKEELSEDDEDDVEVDETEQVVNFKSDITELIQVDDVDTEITEEKEEPSLPILSANLEDYDSLDKDSFAQMDEEAIESLIQYKYHKMWNDVLNDRITIYDIENRTGGEYFMKIKETFLLEYYQVEKWIPNDNYEFNKGKGIIQPNLMQKLTVSRIMKYKNYGNFSGTGAGKTLSYILTSRAIESKLTLVIVVNSTVKETCKVIKNTYPNSVTHSNYELGQVFDRNKYNYLVLNYEKFQLDYSEEKFQDLTNNNIIDFVVIDEVHNAKIRNHEEISSRRQVLDSLMGRMRENNENLHTLIMSATPVINNLTEAKSMLTLLTGNDYDELKTDRSVNNALRIYQHLFLNGIRFIPKYNIKINELTGHNTPNLSINGEHLFEDILKLPNGEVLKIEKLLVPDKLIASTTYLKKGMVIYSHFVTGIFPQIERWVLENGFTCAKFSGNESSDYRDSLIENFVAGNFDILIASNPITTGVDHLQEVCDRMLIITLPWTDALLKQLYGRIYRQGSEFESVQFIIPQVKIAMDNDDMWSWDIQRLNLIKNKRTLADAAVDGLIPSKVIPAPKTMMKKAINSLRLWKERINDGKIITFERKQIDVELFPEVLNQEERVKRVNSELMLFNQKGKVSKSSTTNREFNEKPESFFRYHKLRRARMQYWSEIPYEHIANKITDADDIIVDFGCGENKFKDNVPNNKVIPIDHIAFDDSVIACDMKDISQHVENQSVDIAVFSLSLWGTNFRDYLKEAHRVIRKRGFIYICEPIDSNLDLVALLNEAGFDVVGNVDKQSRFIYITGVKM